MRIKPMTSYDDYVKEQIIVSEWGKGDRLLESIEELLTVTEQIDNMDVRILDIGCRRGEGIRKLHTLGYKNSYGIDIGKAMFLTDDFDKYYMQCDMHESLGFKEKFDIVTIIQTLEHAYDAKKVLENVHKQLNKDGIVYIAIPEGEYENKAHFFAASSIHDFYPIAESAGFEIIDSLQTNDILVPSVTDYKYFLRKKVK